MENLDLIVATAVIVPLFAVFIISTLKEFTKINHNEFNEIKKSSKKPTKV
jgi:hypothetical protein